MKSAGMLALLAVAGALTIGSLAAPCWGQGAQAAGIVPPKPLTSLGVKYPEGASGGAEVTLELLLSEDGSVAQTVVREGVEPFAEAARLTAERFRFSPALRSGIPIRARISVRIVFTEPVPSEPAAASPSRQPVAELEPAKPAPAKVPPEQRVEISIVGEQRYELGSIHVRKEDARRVPGAFGDPFRVAEVLPGVVPVLSGLPYFFVRGAPPGSVGYFIDGIRVPVLFHVGPGPSVIAPALIERVDLFPGAYPARFGRYAGAILAGETAPPSERTRAEAQARIFDASAMVEQPFAEGRGSVLLGGRYSYTQAILAAVAPEYELGYGDYQARVAYAVTPRDHISAFAFGGYELLRNEEQRLTLFDTDFHRLDLRWDRTTKNDRARLGVTLGSDEVLAAPEDLGAPGSAQEIRSIRVRSEVEHGVAPELRLRGGADFGVERVSGDREQVGDGVVIFADRNDVASGLFADVIWRPFRGIEIVPGARLDFMRSRGASHTFFEPRLATRTRLAQGLAHLGGLGLSHQLPATAIRMPGRAPNLIELSEQEAAHLSQGLEYALPEGMLGRTTAFYQAVDIDTPGVKGRSYGLEQFLRRDFTRRLGGFLSYTLSRAEGLLGRQERPSSFDRTHVVSGVLGYDFGRGWRLGARAFYASGRALQVSCPTPDCGPGDPAAPHDFVRQLRLPSFFRLDVRFEKRWRFDNGFWVTGTFEWFNALVASEVDSAHYSAGGIVYEEQSPLTLPSLGIELGY